jgi:DNA-binding LytR/AlgR family response regulator
VAEAQRARSWSQRGGLVPLYGHRQLPPVALEAIDLLEAWANQVDIRTARERQRELTRDREG